MLCCAAMQMAVVSMCWAVALAATPAAPSAVFPWHALPASKGPIILEGGILARDLRGVRMWAAHQRTVLMEVSAGRALFAPGAGERWDGLEEITRVLAAAHRLDSAVPAAVAILSWHGDVALQGMVQADATALARLRTVAGPWQVQERGDLLVLSRAGVVLMVRLGDDGWLRVASHPDLLLPGAGRPPEDITPALQQAALSADGLLFAVGGGKLAQALQERIPQPLARSFLEGVRSVALTWRTDGKKTGGVQLLLDAPVLAPLGAALQPKQEQDSVLMALTSDALGFASLEIPAVLRRALPSIFAQTLAAPPYNAPDEVLAALGDLQGRLGWMVFDAPGDWALSLELSSELDAAALVPALQGWALSMAKSLTPGAAPAFELEPFAGTTQAVLHLRPDTAVEGPYVAARGKMVLLVQQRSRLERLLGPDALTARGMWDGPLTPQVRDAVQPPRLLQMYTVLGGDGTLGDVLVWAAGRAQSLLRQGPPPPPGVEALAKRLPRLLSVLSYLFLRTYDVALTAQVQGTLLTLQMTHSEI